MNTVLERERKRFRRIRAAFVAMLIIVVLVVSLMGGLIISAALESRSPASKFYEICLDAVMGAHSTISEQKTTKTVEKRRKTNKNYKIPTIYSSLYGFTTEEYNGFEVVFFDNADTTDTAVYFHGGSYMWQPLVFHYDYCKYLSENLCLDIVMPVYPKAPEYNYDYALKWVYSYYVENNIEPVAFFGDSAGGGLALSFAQYLVDRGQAVPDDIILFSPCLDLSLSNPEVYDYQDDEPMLNADDLRRKFAYYADGGSLTDPYISPIYCDYASFNEVTVFIGTHEILYPDTKKWDENLTSLNIKHNYYVYENQFHTFSLLPMPERGECLEQIKRALKNAS